jgi:hypothetical protein
MSHQLVDCIYALKAMDREVAIDLGSHMYCSLDSNCPKAVELRRMIGEMGLELTDIVVSLPATIDSRELEELKVSGVLSINLGGNEPVTLCMDNYVSNGIKSAIREKLKHIERVEDHLHEVAAGYMREQVRVLEGLRNVQKLEQLPFSMDELLKYRCMITVISGRYRLLFPFKYAPAYLYKGGTRYAMSPEHVTGMKKRVHIAYDLTVDFRFYCRPHLVQLISGVALPFQQYHGRDSSSMCWGLVELPKVWDKKLSSLYQLTKLLERSLETINLDSLMVHHPNGMPDYGELFQMATVLGREGVIAEPVPEVESYDDTDEDADYYDEPLEETTRGWGT